MKTIGSRANDLTDANNDDGSRACGRYKEQVEIFIQRPSRFQQQASLLFPRFDSSCFVLGYA